MNALIELEAAYGEAKRDPAFIAEFERYLVEYAGRPSMLYFAEKMTKDMGGAKVPAVGSCYCVSLTQIMVSDFT